MARLLTAGLRNVGDDGRRWWAVSGSGLGIPSYEPARSGREAVAAVRRVLIAADLAAGCPHRLAVAHARVRGLTYAGPYTTSAAFVLDAGWHLALAECDRWGGLSLVPAGPVTDLDQVLVMLDADRIARILDQVAHHYRKVAPPCTNR